MKIRFIHQYFYPDISSVSQVIGQIAFHLAARGNKVSVICSRNEYDGGGTACLPAWESRNGVDIHRCPGPSFGRGTMTGRFIDMLSFGLFGTIRAVFSPKADAVILLTNPPFFSILGLVLKHLRLERFIYVLMDVYPDIAVRAGILKKGSLLEKSLRWASRLTLKGADVVVVLGDDMKDIATREGASPEKLVVIRNWADPEVIYPVPPEENRLRRKWGLHGKFVVEYSGNMGVSHFFEDILAVAEEMAGEEEIRFVFIGEGERRRAVKKFVESKRLPNILLLPYQDAADLAESLSVGDVHYISLRRGFEGLVVPSKAYGVMAAGRPIIYQGDGEGEIARMIRQEGIGVVVSPGERSSLRDVILGFYREKEMRIRLGGNARKALKERYSKKNGLEQYEKILSGLL